MTRDEVTREEGTTRRPGTTIALAVLLVAILVAAIVQFVFFLD